MNTKRKIMKIEKIIIPDNINLDKSIVCVNMIKTVFAIYYKSLGFTEKSINYKACQRIYESSLADKSVINIDGNINVSQHFIEHAASTQENYKIKKVFFRNREILITFEYFDIGKLKYGILCIDFGKFFSHDYTNSINFYFTKIPKEYFKFLENMI